MEEKKVIYVRVDKETHKKFAKYAIDYDSNMNKIIEGIIQTVLETGLSPKETLSAIQAKAQEKPGE